TQLSTCSGTGYTGSTVSYTRAVSANQTYYIRVDGANTTSFGTGAYVLSLKFGTAPLPPVVPPNTQILDQFPLSAAALFTLTLPPTAKGAAPGLPGGTTRPGAWSAAPGQAETRVAGVWAAFQEAQGGARHLQASDATPRKAVHGLDRLRTALSAVDTRVAAL